MKKIDFNFDLDDVEKAFGIKKDKKNSSDKDDFTEEAKQHGDYKETEITSLDAQAEKRTNQLKKRIIIIFVVLPIVFMLLKVTVKTIIRLNTEDRKEPQNIEKSVEIEDLHFDKDFTWKTLTDQSIKNMGNQINAIEKNVKQELNSTVHLIKNELQKNNEHMQQVVEAIQENNKQFQENMQKFTIEELRKLDQKYEQRVGQLNSKVSDINLSKLAITQATGFKLPKLATMNDIDKEQKELEERAKKILPPLKIDDNESNQTIEKEEIVYEYFEMDNLGADAISDDYVAENEKATKQQEDKKEELPTFTLMPGFIKGVLVNGSRVNAFLGGSSEPAPIYIRLTGRELIPNDDSVNIDGCLILATGKSDLSKKTVDIRLSEMTCSLTDLDGNKYKIKSAVQGWVFSENGQFGIPGRLITRESEVLKAGLPLAVVEGMINTLTNVLNKQYTNTVGGEGYYSISPAASMGQSFGKTSETILQKYTDYYMKMLDALNPVIEIRAGRKVTIAFKGGEQLKIEPYNDVDTGYFENQIDEVE